MSTASSNVAATELKALMTTVQNLEQYLAVLKGQVEAAAAAKPKAKTAWDKPKREANPWAKFFQRVGCVLDAAGKPFPAKKECFKFCSALRQQKADYDAWTDTEILAERAAWDPAPIFITEEVVAEPAAMVQAPAPAPVAKRRGRPRKAVAVAEAVETASVSPPGTPEMRLEDFD